MTTTQSASPIAAAPDLSALLPSLASGRSPLAPPDGASGGLSGLLSYEVPLVLDALASGASPYAVLEDLAQALPEPLQGPDATGSVPTGASELARADALTYAVLAGAPRLAEQLGPAATGLVVGDDAFALVETYTDPVTGFNAVQLRSLTDDRAVFAVDGTDSGSLPDVVAGLNLARPQVASPAFADMVADAAEAAIAGGRDLVFTGASLGGALAQVGGYEAAEAVLAASPGDAAGRVTVFTVDPLGGRDAAEDANGGRLDPAVLERMNALNIRTEGDIVSRIGSHLGDTLTLQAVDAAGNPVPLPAEDAHVNFDSLLANLTSEELWEAADRGPPAEIGGLTLLANAFGPALSRIAVGLDGLGSDGAGEPGTAALPGGGAVDPTGRFFDLDADGDGSVDLRVALGGAVPGTGDYLMA